MRRHMGPNRSSLDVLCEHMDQCCTASVTLSIFPAVPRRPQEPYDHLNSTVLSGRMTNHCCAVQASLLSDRHSSSFIRENTHSPLVAGRLSTLTFTTCFNCPSLQFIPSQTVSTA